MRGHEDATIDLMRENAQLKASLVDVLSLARVKFGNLDPDANKVFEMAEKLLAEPEGMMRTREETEAFIAEVTAQLQGPMSNVERALMAADRKDARVYLATLLPPSGTVS